MQITIPTLNKGEHYAGITIVEGKPTHHLVVLPGDLAKADWEKAKAWAAEQGGELPTRREQALLFANAPELFKPDWYWSGAQHAAGSDCAWYQFFNYGYQNTTTISYELRARAVRRLIIE
jgi:hypothetical protein